MKIPNGKGCLGGYSRGILKLNEMEKIHVLVGGSGQAGNSSDGKTKSGRFPDGGGTKAGHKGNATCVLGTGGGSTSIRLKNSTNYHRVIAAGGGGGGGWYGGGIGSYGCHFDCSSGGGGSGWVFTESSFNEWKSGDSTESSKFLLDSDYHLTDALTLNGDQEIPLPNGNGTEKGHYGNGYDKITVE